MERNAALLHRYVHLTHEHPYNHLVKCGISYRIVSNDSVEIADPANNACKDPGTPAYGIPLQAQGFLVSVVM